MTAILQEGSAIAVFESLTPAQRARQLGNPDGAVDLAVEEWLNQTNREANTRTVALLGVGPGSHVLEIGFGKGRAVPDVIAQAAGVHYAGLDISPTMVEEPTRFNTTLVAAGRASFHLGSAAHMPFANASFGRVFSAGLVLAAITTSTTSMRRLPVSRSMAPDVQPFPPAALRDRHRNVLRCPAANRSHSMRRMHRISEHHRFIRRQLVEQRFIALDERCLLRRVQLARDRRRFAMFHPQPMQQGDQT
jgi:SAM-dependent methyltransferase